jgi:hypothetical protein
MADEILLANPNTSENKSRRSSVFAVDSDGTWETKKKQERKKVQKTLRISLLNSIVIYKDVTSVVQKYCSYR